MTTKNAPKKEQPPVDETRLAYEAHTLAQMLFYQLAATRRNTPPEALRWGYLMNVGRDSFESIFEKFAAAP